MFKDLIVEFTNSCGTEVVSTVDEELHYELINLDTTFNTYINMSELFTNTLPVKCPITEYRLVNIQQDNEGNSNIYAKYNVIFSQSPVSASLKGRYDVDSVLHIACPQIGRRDDFEI